MKKVNIAVFVSGGGTNLAALIKSQIEGILSHGEIKLVFSNNQNAYALKRAENANIETAFLNKKELGQLEFEKQLIELLKEKNIELIVLAGFMVILSENFTKCFKNRIINIHPSLIPSFCGEGFYGLKVHEEALKYGVKVTGATVHFVNEIPDGGKIISQKAVEVLDGDTPEILQKRVMIEAEWIILPEATEKVCKDILNLGE